MQLLERAVPRRCLIAVTLSLVTLACSDRNARSAGKPDAAPSARGAADQSAPALIATNAAGSDSAVLRLAAATDTALAGTPVQLSIAHVQSVMSDRGFWIGVWGQQVYVFQSAPRPIPIQGGEAYSVRGTVRAAPHTAQGAPRGMAPIDIEAMHAQHIYIVADSVAPSAR